MIFALLSPARYGYSYCISVYHSVGDVSFAGSILRSHLSDLQNAILSEPVDNRLEHDVPIRIAVPRCTNRMSQ